MSAAQTELAAARADLVAAQAAYLRVVGRKPIGALRFARLPVLPRSKDQVKALARQNHPSLISARERYNTASTAKTAAYGLFLPSLSVEGVYTRSGEQSDQIDSATSLAVNGRLNMPIYRGGASFASVRKAAHEAERARFNLIDQERQIDEMVTNAWQGLRTARAQIISASQQVKASKIALDGIRQQQSLGTGTFLDALDSEQSYLDAQVSLVTARRDEYVAAYRLLAGWRRLDGGAPRFGAAGEAAIMADAEDETEKETASGETLSEVLAAIRETVTSHVEANPTSLTRSFDELKDAIYHLNRRLGEDRDSAMLITPEALEEIIVKTARPLLEVILKNWVEQHLPRLAEQIIREEIAKISAEIKRT